MWRGASRGKHSHSGEKHGTFHFGFTFWLMVRYVRFNWLLYLCQNCVGQMSKGADLDRVIGSLFAFRFMDVASTLPGSECTHEFEWGPDARVNFVSGIGREALR
jgi:hypothetical protein